MLFDVALRPNQGLIFYLFSDPLDPSSEAALHDKSLLNLLSRFLIYMAYSIYTLLFLLRTTSISVKLMLCWTFYIFV